VFTIDLDNLTMFVKKGDNVRIAGAAGDVVMKKYAESKGFFDFKAERELYSIVKAW